MEIPSKTDPLFRWNGPIIDAHAHPRGLGSDEPLDTDRIDSIVAYSRRNGVVRMSALGEVLFRRAGYSKVEIRWLNDRNAEMTARHPDFFIPFCFLDPTLGADFVREEVTRCHEVHGFRCVKLETACNVAHPSTRAVFETAGERGFPVLVHATDTDTISNREYQSDSADVRTAVKDFPQTTIIVAHLTAVGARGVWDVLDLPHVVIDTSGMQPDSGIVEYAVERLGADRVVFGSDMCGRDIPPQVGQVLGAAVSDADKQKIFYDNAVRLLGLEER